MAFLRTCGVKESRGQIKRKRAVGRRDERIPRDEETGLSAARERDAAFGERKNRDAQRNEENG